MIAFGSTGDVRLQWEDLDPSSGPLEIAGPEGPWACLEAVTARGTLTHSGAPPMTDFRIQQDRRLLAEGRTPEYYPVIGFKLLPMDDRVLAGLLFLRPCPLILTVRSEDGRVVARTDVQEVKRKHRLVLEGLSPRHSYQLDAEIPGAWGGFFAYPFRTLDTSHRSELRRATKHDWTKVTRHDFTVGALLGGQPDVRLVPVLEQILEIDSDPTTLSGILMRHLDAVFDPRLDDELAAAIQAHPGDHSLAYRLLDVLSWSGATPAVTLAEDRVRRDPGNPQAILALANAAHHAGRPSDFESCLTVFESSEHIDEAMASSLEAMNPVRAMAAYRDWLGAIVEGDWSPGRCLPRPCALPLRSMAAGELATLEAKCLEPGLREFRIETLIEADAPTTRRHLVASFARTPTDIPLLWSMARIGERSAVTTITEGLKSAKGLLLADSIAVLGLLGADESIGPIEERLGDPDPYARRAAAWALGLNVILNSLLVLSRNGTTTVWRHGPWADSGRARPLRVFRRRSSSCWCIPHQSLGSAWGSSS
jgi:hypothetical protein